MEIKKEEFLKMTTKSQNITIYNSVINLEKKIDTICGNMAKRNKVNSVYALIGGILGGFVAIISKWLVE